MDGRFRFFHPISYRNQSPRRSRSRYRWIGPCFIFLLAFQLLAFQAQAQPSMRNQTGMLPGRAVSLRPTTPSSHHILWTDNCDPRTDASHCSEGDPDILTPFYDVVDSLGAQLVYHVPTSLQELNEYDVVIANFCSQHGSDSLVGLLKLYVATGGSLVVMGDNFCVAAGYPYANSAAWATKLTQGWGIVFTEDDDIASQFFTPVVSHPITAGVRQIYSPRHAFLTLSGTAQAVFAADGKVFMALYDATGTVIAIPDVGFQWNRTSTLANDNFVLWRTMLGWLIEQRPETPGQRTHVYLPLVLSHNVRSGQISGRVTAADTGRGIANAWLNIFTATTWEFETTAFADEMGTFTTPALPPGRYKIILGPQADADQVYANQWYDNKPDFASADEVVVIGGQVTAGINPALQRGAQISGRVTAADTGAALEGIYVIAYDVTTTASERSTQTDASGAYHIRGLRSGTYEIHFLPPESGPASEYAEEWYNDKPDFGPADDVMVAAPNSVTGIDATLARRP